MYSAIEQRYTGVTLMVLIMPLVLDTIQFKSIYENTCTAGRTKSRTHSCYISIWKKLNSFGEQCYIVVRVVPTRWTHITRITIFPCCRYTYRMVQFIMFNIQILITFDR